jgi:hypothetical protein
MLTALNALQGAESLLLTLARIWAAVGELLTAGALLLVLDRIAAAIRTTYQAGALIGRVLWPAIHWSAAVLRIIDWRLVGAVMLDTAKALAVLAWVATVQGHRLLMATSEALGRCYAALLAVPVAPVKPVAHPLVALALGLEALSCRELRALIGTRRRCSKAQLIAMALAC